MRGLEKETFREGHYIVPGLQRIIEEKSQCVHSYNHGPWDGGMSDVASSQGTEAQQGYKTCTEHPF